MDRGCALADVVVVPFAEKGNKTYITVRQVQEDGVPLFTCQYSEDKSTDVNKDLFVLGIPSFKSKTVGSYLESLGAGTDMPPPIEAAEDRKIRPTHGMRQRDAAATEGQGFRFSRIC